MNSKIKAAVIAHGLFAAALGLLPAAPALARVMAGSAPTLVGKDIIGSAVNSRNHTMLVAAVKAAGLADALKWMP